MSVARARSLVDMETAAQAKVEREAVARAVAAVGAVESWYVPADVQALSRQIGATARSASRAAAGTTDAYLTRMLSMMLDAPAKSVGVLDLSTPLRAGVESYEQVYARVAEHVRYLESTGLSRWEAVERAQTRVDAMVRTDLALARRGQSRAVYAGTPRVTGYRRIIRPELSTTGTCGLCAAASGRVYSRDTLLPIHYRCKCTTMPILGENDPGREIDDETLAQIYDAAGSTGAADLKQVRFTVVQHTELGPTLVDPKHRSTHPGTRPSAEPRSARGPQRPSMPVDPARMLAAEIRALESRLPMLESRAATGEPGLDQAIAYQRERIALLGTRLRAL